jgi:hypothetical protein
MIQGIVGRLMRSTSCLHLHPPISTTFPKFHHGVRLGDPRISPDSRIGIPPIQSTRLWSMSPQPETRKKPAMAIRSQATGEMGSPTASRPGRQRPRGEGQAVAFQTLNKTRDRTSSRLASQIVRGPVQFSPLHHPQAGCCRSPPALCRVPPTYRSRQPSGSCHTQGSANPHDPLPLSRSLDPHPRQLLLRRAHRKPPSTAKNRLLICVKGRSAGLRNSVAIGFFSFWPMAGHGFWTAPVAEGIRRKEIREAQETQIEETEGDCPGLLQTTVVAPTPSPQPWLQTRERATGIDEKYAYQLSRLILHVGPSESHI